MRGRAALVAAALGVLALAGSLTALAAQQPAARRAGHAATHPPCAPPVAGVHRIVVAPGRPALLVVVPPGRPAGRRPVLLVRPEPGLSARDLARATRWSPVARRQGALVAYVDGRAGDAAYARAAVRALTGQTGCGAAAHTRWVAGPAPAAAGGYRPAGRRRA